MTVELYHGDCLDILPTLEAESVDTIITDPPYGLEFMGKDWDHGVPGVAYWKAALRVAKPGAMLLAFGGRRTEHRLVCAIEDAGWQIIDKVAWVYSQGFPKSYNVSKNLTKAIPSSLRCVCEYHSMGITSSSQSDCRPADGLCDGQLRRGQDSAPGASPSQDDVLGRSRAGQGADDLCIEQGHSPGHSSNGHLSIGDCVLLLEHLSRDSRSGGNRLSGKLENMLRGVLTESRKMAFRIYGTDDLASDSVSSLASASPPNNYVTSIYHKCPSCQMYYAVEGYGTALKPAIEGICVARKPFDTTNCINALEHGVAGLWVDGGRVATNWETDPTRRGWQGGGNEFKYDQGHRPIKGKKPLPPLNGRWPANLILDEYAGAMLDEQSGERPTSGRNGESGSGQPAGLFGMGSTRQATYWDTGGASRFFYCAKASRSERTCNGEIENKHPTVKPLALMRYLVRLTKTPTGGIVLDPLMGSGSTGVACILEGRDFIGIDSDEESFIIATQRTDYAQNEMIQLEMEAT